MWKVNHLDWKKRIAHVEATNDKGRSRWLGEGQSLSHAVCQSIRKILASDENDPSWSTRAKDKLHELRDEHPWVYSDATSLVQQPNGQIRWWTFAGGIANSLLANALKPHCDVRSDNLSLVFASAGNTESVGSLIQEINERLKGASVRRFKRGQFDMKGMVHSDSGFLRELSMGTGSWYVVWIWIKLRELISYSLQG